MNKNVKSDELKHADKHQHGVQPSQTQKDSLLPSLYSNVAAAYDVYNNQHATAQITAPSDDTIKANKIVKTRSAH